MGCLSPTRDVLQLSIHFDQRHTDIGAWIAQKLTSSEPARDAMIKQVSTERLVALTDEAKGSPRKRSHLNTHPAPEAAVQRLFIALEPETYIRPHRHPQAEKWEFLVLIQGEIDLIIFDDDGAIIERIELSTSAVRTVELEPNTWHSYVCKEPDSIALEIKEGAYIPTAAGDFASWAPGEGTIGVDEYLVWMASAKLGESAPAMFPR